MGEQGQAELACTTEPYTDSLCVPAPSRSANLTLRDKQIPNRAQGRGHQPNATSSHVVCGSWDLEARGNPSTTGSKGHMRDKHGSQDSWFLKGIEKIWEITGKTQHSKFPPEDKGRELCRTHTY